MIEISEELSLKFKNMSFFCACLVALIHVPVAPDVEKDFFFWLCCTGLGPSGSFVRIAVPFFFLASGFFLAGKFPDGDVRWGVWRNEVTKRVWSLLIPYFLWNLIYLFYILLFMWAASKVGYSFNYQVPDFKTFAGLFNALGFNFLEGSYHRVLWFMRCLFVFVLLSPVVIWFVRRFRSVVAYVLLFVALCALTTVSMKISEPVYKFFRWRFALEGLFYFVLGIAIRFGRFRGMNCRALTCFFVAIGGGAYLMNVILLYNGSATFSEPLHWIAYSGFLYLVWCLVPGKKRFREGAIRYSFHLYILHMFTMPLVSVAFSLSGLKNMAMTTSIALYFLRTGLVIVTALVVAHVLCKFQRMAGFLFGSRV